MFPADDKRVEFLDRLIRLTELDRVTWEQGRDEFWFKASFSRFTYAIASEDEDDLAPYTMRVYRAVGPNEQSGPPLAEWEWDLEEGDHPVNLRLRRLYLTVKRRVVGYHSVMDGMLQDLAEAEAQGELE